MDTGGAKNTAADVEENPRNISNVPCDCGKDFLGHGIMGIDIEHVDGAVSIQENIQEDGNAAADKVEDTAADITAQGGGRRDQNCCGKSKDKQPDMPEIRMDGQREVVVMHSAGVKEGKDSPKESVIYEKSGKGMR